MKKNIFYIESLTYRLKNDHVYNENSIVRYQYWLCIIKRIKTSVKI